MKSIERRFREVERKNPFHSTYINFHRAIEGQKFSRKALARWFNKLVDKDDYARSDRTPLLAHIERATNTREEGEKRG